MTALLLQATFPYDEVASKVALASGIGLLVGLEREWAQKEIGVRTFGITGLLGMLAMLLGPSLVYAGVAAVLLTMTFLNIHSLLRDRSLELTTSICLVVVYVLGCFVGGGHYFTAATSAIVMMLLLSWKSELERFADALRPEEIRSAVLLGLLSVVIYPLLPNRAIDAWQLINLRQAWVIVVVIAGIGFVNYVLLRLYSTKGLYYAAALGGLVNSTAAVVELSALFRGREELIQRAVAALLLTNVAMFVRNGVILAIFAPKVVVLAMPALSIMVTISAAFALRRNGENATEAPPLKLTSPVSLFRVIKFGVLFLMLSAAGTLAQRYLGRSGFLVISVLGGLVSSASTTATAAALTTVGKLDPFTAAIATVLTSMASCLVNMPLVYQQTRQKVLTQKLATITILVLLIGLIVLSIESWIMAHSN